MLTIWFYSLRDQGSEFMWLFKEIWHRVCVKVRFRSISALRFRLVEQGVGLFHFRYHEDGFLKIVDEPLPVDLGLGVESGHNPPSKTLLELNPKLGVSKFDFVRFQHSVSASLSKELACSISETSRTASWRSLTNLCRSMSVLALKVATILPVRRSWS